MKYDWLKDLKNFPDWQKVKHFVIIPTYKEPVYILERTLTSLAKQELPLKQLYVILAMEAKEDEADRKEKVAILKKKFGKDLPNFFVNVHTLAPGEAVGKSSNERSAAIWVKKDIIDKQKLDLRYLTVTSCDADHKYHPKHFAALTYKFLDNPDRYARFWQSAVMFYNNIWELPAVTRVPNTLSSIWNLSQLPRKDRLINAQNYSLSFKLLHEVDYWDPDKIPEDWGLFYKAYFAKKGGLEVEAIYLPLHADAPRSATFWATLKNQYDQYKRWAWGVSDVPWILRNYLLTKEVPFTEKTLRVGFVIWSHVTWPISWFFITVGLTLPSLINPQFARTALGYTVPKFSSAVLTVALVFLFVMILLDNVYRPHRPKEYPFWKTLLGPFEFALMPIVGFFFSALPGIDAHTRLMLGKYMEYKVTEKV